MNVNGIEGAGGRVRVLFARVAIAALGFAPTGVATAQQTPTAQVADAVSCRPCGIEMRLHLSVGDASGPGAIFERPPVVQTLRNGNVLIGSTNAPLKLYSSAGKFLRTIGAAGNGPGEFREPMLALRTPGDSLVLFDGGTQRATVLDATLTPRRYISTGLSPFFNGAVVSWPGNVWLSGRLFASEESGVLHAASLASRDLGLERTFGAIERPPNAAPERSNAMAAIPDGAWTVSPRQYSLRHWDRAGRLTQSLDRVAPWFDAPSLTLLGGPAAPPKTQVRALWVDQQNLVWVLLWLPAPTWREAWAGMSRGRGEADSRKIDESKLYSSRIEVIDPARKAVVARLDVPQWLTGFTADGYATSFELDFSDQTSVKLYSLRLRRP